MLSNEASKAVLDGSRVELRKKSFVVHLNFLADEILGWLGKQ